VLPDGPALVAGEVRSRLFSALSYVMDAAATVYPSDADELLYVLQPDPLMIQVVKRATSDRPASALLAFKGERLPAPLALVITSAIDDLTAGVLSTLGGNAAAMAVGYAAQVKAGGFFVLADPMNAYAALILAVEGRPLDRGIVLGAVIDAQTTAH
jgi:hypothetical protein